MLTVKKNIFRYALITFSAIATFFVGHISYAAPSYRAHKEIGLGAVKNTQEKTDAAQSGRNEKGEKEVFNHIVVICGHSDNKNKITLNDYTRAADGTWNKNWAVNGICGSNGISADKKEGDKKTPEGFFAPTTVFGIKDDPGSRMGYHKLVRGDLWVDDSESPYYNKMVNTATTPKNWKSAENMIEEAPFYNYGIALNYNEESIPYKGSAIFIHCTKTKYDEYSAGCIRIPEEYMKKLIQSTDADTRFFIMANQKTWEEYKANNR